MSHRIKTTAGNRLFSLAILDDADPGEVEDLIVELEATSGGVTRRCTNCGAIPVYDPVDREWTHIFDDEEVGHSSVPGLRERITAILDHLGTGSHPGHDRCIVDEIRAALEPG